MTRLNSDTFGTTIDVQEFEHMSKQATVEPYGFSFIDTVPKKEYMRFRSGFNHYLIPRQTNVYICVQVSQAHDLKSQSVSMALAE